MIGMLRWKVRPWPVVVSSEAAVKVVVKAFLGGEVEGWLACERISRGPVRSRVSRLGWAARRTLRVGAGGDILMRVVVGFDGCDELDELDERRLRGKTGRGKYDIYIWVSDFFLEEEQIKRKREK